MLEYYGNRLCIPARELIDQDILTESNYKAMSSRGKIEKMRNGGGVGGYALVVVDSLPEHYKSKVKELYPEGSSVRLRGWVESNYELDQNAVAYFMSSSQCGIELPQDKAKGYAINASVLNTCIKLYNNTKAIRKTMGEKFDWTDMAKVIEILRQSMGHTLPSSTLRFRKKVAEYRRDGYGCLISGKFGNQNTRKVDYKTERLMLGLAILPNKPFNGNVWEMYNSFVCGELEVYDPESGELFNCNDFLDKKGNPLELSEATINNYLNKPKNRVLIQHKLDSWTTFMHEQAPHVHRHAPEFSLSKISFDDRDLPRKLRDTKARPKAYYAYDVATGCVVGAAYSRDKKEELVVECFRDMFRLLDRNGWNCPAQVEVENHLMSQWRDSFLKAGTLFPFVRFCAPQNSQEKYAEAMNGAKKKSVEHKNHLGIGRFYSKGKWRTEARKISDSSNNTYEDQEYYSWEQLIAEDRADVAEWNNSLHPNQKKYPGMTRWQVLESNINPTLQPVDRAVLARYIGDYVKTSIRRNSYCQVDYKSWWLSDTKVLEKLAPNNYEVDAYYLTDATGNFNEVYLYQNGQYIDTVSEIKTFNRADAEHTDEDLVNFVAQQKKIANFNRYVSDNEIQTVRIQKTQIGSNVETVAEATAVEDVQAAGRYEKKDAIADF